MSGAAKNWLEANRFEVRSCLLKKRYSCEPSHRMNQYAYQCEFCDGWHLATKRNSESAMRRHGGGGA